MTRFALVICGGGLAAFGLWALLDPVGIWTVFGLPVADDPSLRTELRAFYGGFELGVGAAILWHLGGERGANGLVVSMLAYGALGTARAIGIAVEGEASAFQLGALATEIALTALAAVAYRRERRS